MHLIEVRDVYKIYNPGENQVNALDGVSITIDEGEFVAIIGQSGSGKSTLMNMLGLLDTPTHGEYYINGKLVDDLTDDQMSAIRNEEIGFIFQGFNLISSLTALENVELPLVYRGMPKQERREISQDALERVGLGGRMNHLPAEMSGGQQQRVAVARAIAANLRVTLILNQQKKLWLFCTNLKMRAEQLLLSPTIMKLQKKPSVLFVFVTERLLKTISTRDMKKSMEESRRKTTKTRLTKDKT